MFTASDLQRSGTFPGGRSVSPYDPNAAMETPGGRIGMSPAAMWGPELASYGMIGGAPAIGWNDFTKSTPYMDIGSGHIPTTWKNLMSKYPPDKQQVDALKAEGNGPGWYVLGATTYEQVAAYHQAQASEGFPPTMSEPPPTMSE